MHTKPEAIIFDFGGVIINIDPSLTVQAFEKLSGSKSLVQRNYNDFQRVHNLFETGEINPKAFRDRVRELLGLKHVDDNGFDNAWNALLLDIPLYRIRLIDDLKSKYRLFLLSNTNEIHYVKYCSDFSRVFKGKTLEGLFEQAFFSFKMGLKKPDPEIFFTVARQCRLDPDRTLFIDDTLEHVEAALHCGFQAYHHNSMHDITSLFGHDSKFCTQL